jgi:hypothetical protein
VDSHRWTASIALQPATARESNARMPKTQPIISNIYYQYRKALSSFSVISIGSVFELEPGLQRHIHPELVELTELGIRRVVWTDTHESSLIAVTAVVDINQGGIDVAEVELPG